MPYSPKKTEEKDDSPEMTNYNWFFLLFLYMNIQKKHMREWFHNVEALLDWCSQYSGVSSVSCSRVHCYSGNVTHCYMLMSVTICSVWSAAVLYYCIWKVFIVCISRTFGYLK